MGISSDVLDLVKAAQNNNAAAENQLFEQLSARLFNLAKYILLKAYGIRDATQREEDAKDIMQTAIMTIHQKYKSLEFDEGFFSWVNRILRNTIGNYMRKKSWESRKWVWLNEMRADVIPDGPEIEVADVEYRELLGAITKWIRDLDAVCRQVMEVFLNGGTRETLLQTFPNMPLGTLDNKIYRCRQRLKRLLQREGYLP